MHAIALTGLTASMLVSGAGTASASEPAIVKTEDIVYGHAVDCTGQEQDLVLDMYELEGDTRPFRPVYVWGHGGFFKYGDEEGIRGDVIDYVRSGWVVVSIDYRLCDTIPEGYPGILESLLDPEGPADGAMDLVQATEDTQHDMQAAVRWVRRYAGTRGFDASRVAAGGFSAGAITALQTAFDSDDPGDSGNPGYPSTIDAAVSHGGGYVHGLMGSIDPGEPPIAMLHGTHDTTVPIATAVPACTQTTALLNVCEFTPYVGGTHNVLGAEVALDFLRRQVVDVPRTVATLGYEGSLDGSDGTLDVQARLTAPSTGATCGLLGCEPQPLAGREVLIEVAGVSTTLVTDDNGVASARLVLPGIGGDHALVARYHGEPGLEPAVITESIAGPVSAVGHMTGDGGVGDATHQFALRCGPAGEMSDLTVTAADGRAFQLESVNWVFCFDSAAVAGETSSFDSLRGEGSGTWDGQGGAVIRFAFTDVGAPGTQDAVDLEVLDASGRSVLTLSGTLNSGNHRVHSSG